ncbi:MAG TPA: alpha/beta hydrolase [Bryobacteraceae bacterium]|jgi:pimeloyl-ACP methyl ester carboxylesterase|nr:alpha/beta hydrolase [Bryobacteraceae bacterium]
MNTVAAGVSLILLMLVSVAGSAPSTGAKASELVAPYLKPPRLVRIRGRTINLVCIGQGSPTVVLTAGARGWSLVWYRIQGEISQKTRVCAWDPAGLGFSSASPEPQDAIHKTEDLALALKGADVDGLYVMVAHSAGAYVALTFADQHREAVAGIVLLDPAIPDEAAVRERVAPKFAAFGDAGPSADVERLRQCAAGMRSGALKQGTPGFDECTAQPLPTAFASLSATLAQLNADPARLLTQASPMENALRSEREVVNAKRNYADMPLIVLTAGQHPMPPNVPADVREQAAEYFRALGSGHKAYAALSTRGRNELVPDSGHFIQLESPVVVVQTIEQVLAEIRAQRSQGPGDRRSRPLAGARGSVLQPRTNSELFPGAR